MANGDRSAEEMIATHLCVSVVGKQLEIKMKIFLRENGGWKLFDNPSKDELESRNIKIGYLAEIGDGAKIGARAKIGDGVKIGDWAEIGNGVEIRDGAEIGDGAVINHSPIVLYGKYVANDYGNDYIRVGCEVHKSSKWTKRFIGELCKEHNENSQFERWVNHVVKIIKADQKLYKEQP